MSICMIIYLMTASANVCVFVYDQLHLEPVASEIIGRHHYTQKNIKKLSLKSERGRDAICFIGHLQKYLCYSINVIKQSSINITFCKKPNELNKAHFWLTVSSKVKCAFCVLKKEIKHIWKIQQQETSHYDFSKPLLWVFVIWWFYWNVYIRRWPYEGIQIRILWKIKEQPNRSQGKQEGWLSGVISQISGTLWWLMECIWCAREGNQVC